MTANVTISKTELVGPMKIMNRPISSARHLRGTVRYSGSMSSHGIVVWEKSYNKLSVSS